MTAREQRGSTTALAERVADRAAVGVPTGPDLFAEVRAQQGAIERAIPKGIGLSPERFLRVVTTELRTKPDLLACSRESILGALMLSAQLGLEFGPLGLAYMVPRTIKGRDEVQFMVGYKGICDLARRSGEIKSIVARPVYENDSWRYWEDEEGDHMRLERTEDERGPVVRHYGHVIFTNGGSLINVLTLEDIARRRAFSAGSSSKYSPWNTNPLQMGNKSVIHDMKPWLPLTTDVAQGLAGDEQIVRQTKSGELSIEYVTPDDDEAALSAGEPSPPERIRVQRTDVSDPFPQGDDTPPDAQEPPPGDADAPPPSENEDGPQGAVPADLIAEVRRAVFSWPDERVNEISRDWKVEVKGNLQARRIRLAMVLAEAKAAGDPAALDLL